MTLYEFKMLDETQQFETIWSTGVFIDSITENGYGINLYSIDMFFVEVVYDAKANRIIENRPFKEGHLLDKYSPNLKTEY